MKKVKDNFSAQAENYKKYRPGYPNELYELILHNCANFDLAWDCATGNGQVAEVLSNHFKKVIATDISDKQLSQALKTSNIEYRKARAELSGLEDNSIDLITVGQAVHWFEFDKFYNEAHRVLKTDGIIAIWAYGTFKVKPQVDAIILDFYKNIVGPYWDPERRFIDQEYKTIPFPFTELEHSTSLNITQEWTLDELEGYLNTWSSVAHFRKENDTNPINRMIKNISPFWHGKEVVSFPLFIRLGTK